MFRHKMRHASSSASKRAYQFRLCIHSVGAWTLRFSCIPAMAAEAGRETRQGAESDEESVRVRLRNTTYMYKRFT
jgi:hypothetical protein